MLQNILMFTYINKLNKRYTFYKYKHIHIHIGLWMYGFGNNSLTNYYIISKILT